MEDLNYLSRLDKVEAPLDFEQGVMARLEPRRRSRKKQKVLSFSLAGATAAFLACLAILNLIELRKNIPAGMADMGKKQAVMQTRQQETTSGQFIPVLETLDYFDKTRARSTQPETVYLLEQISYTPQRGIKY